MSSSVPGLQGDAQCCPDPDPDPDPLPVTSVSLGSRPTVLLAHKGRGWEGGEKPLAFPPTSQDAPCPWPQVWELGCSHLVNVSGSLRPRRSISRMQSVCSTG